MEAFEFHTTPSIAMAPGASGRIASLAGLEPGARVLLVTDPGIAALRLHDPVVLALEQAGCEVAVFARIEADPRLATLHSCVEVGREEKVTAVVGFGGGSSLDVAKLTALLLGSGECLDSIWGVGKAQGPRLPLVLVPTTAGTGSEATPVSIITVGADEKRGVSSPVLLPDLAILDVELTLSLPPAVTAATGIDAMVHAIEAYSSANPNNNPISRNLALQALGLLSGNIERVIYDGSDREARASMLFGSLLAGQAFANSPVGAVHALAYPLGGIFHLPHGLSNALVLPHVLQFNMPAAIHAYAALLPVCFPTVPFPGDSGQCAARFIMEIAALAGRVGLPARLRDVGITKDDLPQLARESMKQTRLLANNPRSVDEADALSIYTAAW